MSDHVALDERQIVAVKLELEGMQTTQMAKHIGVSDRTIYRWRELPAYQSLLTTMREDMHRAARHTLKASAHLAASRIAELVGSSDERVALSAAQTLLDRTGHPKTDRVELAAKVAGKVEVTDAAGELAKLMGGE